MGMPYTIRQHRGRSFGKYLSQSTTAMVTLSLHRLLGVYRGLGALDATQGIADLSYLDNVSKEYKTRASKIADQAARLLLARISPDGEYKTHSGTYGDNDPITIAFLAELSASLSASSEQINALERFIRSTVEDLVDDSSGNKCDNQRSFFQKLREGCNVLPNAIIPLRVVQAYYRMSRGQQFTN
jgi:hypothetical protein